MKLTHYTKDGSEVRICEMTDQHLKNHINLLLSNAEACKNLIKAGPGSESISEMIHGISRKQQIGQAKQKIKQIYDNLPVYIMEASIRGIDFGDRMREVFERKKETVVFELPLTVKIEDLIQE